MGFGSIHLRRGGAGCEDPQDAELEVTRVAGIGPGQFSEGDVTAVAVPGVFAPAAEEAFGPICFAHVKFAGLVIGIRPALLPVLAQLTVSAVHSITRRLAMAEKAEEGRRSKKRRMSVRSLLTSPWFSKAVMNRARRP